MWLSDNDFGIEWPLSKNKSETNNFASDIDHDYGQTSQEQVRKYTHNVDLGAETSLQSQSHSYWYKMSILQIYHLIIVVLRSYSQTHSSSLFGLHLQLATLPVNSLWETENILPCSSIYRVLEKHGEIKIWWILNSSYIMFWSDPH